MPMMPTHRLGATVLGLVFLRSASAFLPSRGPAALCQRVDGGRLAATSARSPPLRMGGYGWSPEHEGDDVVARSVHTVLETTPIQLVVNCLEHAYEAREEPLHPPSAEPSLAPLEAPSWGPQEEQGGTHFHFHMSEPLSWPADALPSGGAHEGAHGVSDAEGGGLAASQPEEGFFGSLFGGGTKKRAPPPPQVHVHLHTHHHTHVHLHMSEPSCSPAASQLEEEAASVIARVNAMMRERERGEDSTPAC